MTAPDVFFGYRKRKREKMLQKMAVHDEAGCGSLAATVIPCGPKIPCRVTTENGEELMMMQPSAIIQDIVVKLPQ